MKKTNNIRILLLTLLSVAAVGCSDFLDRTPWDAIDTSKSFEDVEDAVAAVNGAYQPLQWPKIHNMRIWTLDIVAGNSIVGAGGGTDGIETTDLSNFVTTTDNFGVLDMWRGPAPGILRCNTVIQNIAGLNIESKLKDRCLGEVKFLRGYYYFLLVRLFGGVPLITEPQNSTQNLKPIRASKEQIYELIIQDLEDAIKLLPDRSTYTGADVGRASQGAAMGLLAKVYLTLGRDDNDYKEVVRLCDEVTALGYSLNIDYSDNFNPLKKNGQESLFEVQYFGKTSADFWSNENQSNWLSAYMGPRNSGMVAAGWGWNQPTSEFVTLYEENDQRKDKTIMYDGCPDYDGQIFNASFSYTGYNVRKWLVTKAIAPANNSNPANTVVLRYADILLMKAEALNEQGFTSDAEGPLFEVRQRAGLRTRADIEGLSKEQMRETIIKERRIELAFEGERWFDLVRLKNNYAINFLHAIGKANAASKHLLMPIPLKEIEANGNLVQNLGY